MKELDTLIKNEKNKETQVLGPLINKMKRDVNMIDELKESTRYLDIEYDNVSIGQRFYHVWFNEHSIRKCKYCTKNAKFSTYDRFSDKIGKKDSNYYTHCGSVRCLIEDFKERGNSKQGYGALIAKISGNSGTRKELLLLTSFLNEVYSNISDSQRFYHIFFNKMDLELCEFCGEPRKYGFMNKFSEAIDKKDSNYCRTCSKIDCARLANVKYSKIGTLNKYGVGNIWNIPGYRENVEKNNLEKWGSPYIMGSEHFKEKTKEKIEREWGGSHPTKHKSVQDKIKKTTLEKYGYDCILKDREKMKKGMLEKYGEDHNMKILSIHEKTMKSMKRYYSYILPSGKIIKLQGYEKFGVEYLLNFFDESDIETDQKEINKILGQIKYGMDKKYYPDIYVKSINKIFEIKSSYIYNLNLEKNLAKKEACERKGIEFEFLIFDNLGNLIKK
jgi:hypothetical protein